jgi:methylglyoxal synthase
MNIALIAHDKKKKELILFIKEHLDFFSQHILFATGHTGSLIKAETGLRVTCFLSGPLGGDQQIGSKVACGKIDLVIFFRDPLTPQPHEPDVSALLRLCDVHKVPVATNYITADYLLAGLKKKIR